jgi:hypothetical protein
MPRDAMSDTEGGPARNRVSPLGDIVAVAGRGEWVGNRGRLHRGDGTREIVRNHQTKAWLTCALRFRDRRVSQWQPGRYTPLFFLDEAVALAAGHRPCAECRHRDYNAYRARWITTHGGHDCRARDIDDQLHRERCPIGRAARPITEMSWLDLPDGVFVRSEDRPAVVVGDHLAVWNAQDNLYRQRLPRPGEGTALVITPPSTVDVLRAGYPVQIDDSAR